MAIECVCRADIKAAAVACFETAVDALRWREWARDLDRVDVLRPLSATAPMRVDITIAILGAEKSAILDLFADPEANAMTFQLVESQSLDAFAGGVRFTPDGSRSRMDANLHAVLTRPRAARIERMVSRKIETALTRDFLRYMERGRR